MTSLSIIEIERIKPHAANVRRDLGDLAELAASIKAQGLLQPLTVAPSDDDYLVIAGHRRLAAAQQAGLATVPCIIRSDLSTQKAQIEAMLVENLQRSDLTVMEEADAYAQLELLGVKEAGIAKATGRSKATVHQRLLLAGLPTKRRQEFEAGKLSLEAAVMCAKLRAQYDDDPGILELIDKAPNWKFTSSYGLKYDIKRVLEDRKPKPQPDDDPMDDSDEISDDNLAIRNQTTVESQLRDAERDKQRARFREMWVQQTEYMTDRLDLVFRSQDLDFGWLGTLARAIVELSIEDDAIDDPDVYAYVGIEEGQDDWTDAQALAAILLNSAGNLLDNEPSQWISNWTVKERLRILIRAAYEPTDEESDLINGEDQ